MLRKNFTLFILLIAQSIILGHSFIPHHHHSDLHGQKQDHHHDKDGQHQHSDENALELALSGFIHAGEQITYTNTDATKIMVSKDVTKEVTTSLFYFHTPIEYIVVHQKHRFPPDRHRIYKSPQNGVHKLRGPPTLIVS